MLVFIIVVNIITFQNFMGIIESWLEEEENWKKLREAKLYYLYWSKIHIT